MARPYKWENTEAFLNALKEAFAKPEKANKMFETLAKDKLVCDDKVAELTFSTRAWSKIWSLVSGFDTEVQWYGLVNRISPIEFVVEDILVPPHDVTAATVTCEDAEFATWFSSLTDDEVNTMRFHGHSHVNMATSPSGVDNRFRDDMVSVINKDDENAFYIFFIMNKKGEYTAEIFDVKNNLLYSTAEKTINLDVIDESGSIAEFMKNARKVVRNNKLTKTYTSKVKEKETHLPYAAIYESDWSW